MSKNPGVTWFGDNYKNLDFYMDTFDPIYCSKEQADYLAEHSEVTTLAALFVARMVQRKVWCRNTLKEAGLFFNRSTEILEEEIKREQKETEKPKFFTPRATENKPSIETDSIRPRRDDFTKVSFTEFRPALSASVETLYSSFVTDTTSASTLPVEEIPEPSEPTLIEFMHQHILDIMNTGLNEMYAKRQREIVYDEAYLCLMRSIQEIVETKWIPIIEDFKELLEAMVDDVRRMALQRQLLKLRAIDKVPIKVERSRNNYRGYSSKKIQPPSKNEIVETMKKRKSRFNRYPKDAFGVYISSKNETNSSVTSEFIEYEFSSDSLNSIAPSHRSYASTCLPTMPFLPFLHRSVFEFPTSKSIVAPCANTIIE